MNIFFKRQQKNALNKYQNLVVKEIDCLGQKMIKKWTASGGLPDNIDPEKYHTAKINLFKLLKMI